jgi:hypothetical protein
MLTLAFPARRAAYFFSNWSARLRSVLSEWPARSPGTRRFKLSTIAVLVATLYPNRPKEAKSAARSAASSSSSTAATTSSAMPGALTLASAMVQRFKGVKGNNKRSKQQQAASRSSILQDHLFAGCLRVSPRSRCENGRWRGFPTRLDRVVAFSDLIDSFDRLSNLRTRLIILRASGFAHLFRIGEHPRTSRGL